MRGVGCLLFLLILVVLVGEGFLAWWLAAQVGEGRVADGLLPIILCGLGLSVAGWYLMRWRIKTMALAMLGGRGGPAMVGILGAALIVFPGFATAGLGMLLQLPPVQALFGKVASKVMQAYVKKAMGGMAAGGGGRFAGFPGMQPDARLRRGAKTIDTTGERQ